MKALNDELLRPAAVINMLCVVIGGIAWRKGETAGCGVLLRILHVFWVYGIIMEYNIVWPGPQSAENLTL